MSVHVTADGWVSRVRRLLSPNVDARPANARIELVVLHCISLPPGKFGTGLVQALFTNTLDCTQHPAMHDLQGVEVSAHLFIDRRGRTWQFASFEDRAWHAGVSSWRGRPGCNDYSIGIELEGLDTGTFTLAQTRRLGSILQALWRRYPSLGPGALVGHEEIAPGRKTDPGPGLHWGELLKVAHVHRR